MDFTSNFKDKSEKEAPYKILLKESDQVGGWMPTFTYSGEFKVTVKTVAPNYDYTVYNMATEPVVKSVEKYYGGH